MHRIPQDPGILGFLTTREYLSDHIKHVLLFLPVYILHLANVWFSERDIRLIVRIFDFKEYIFNFEDQSLKDF